MTESLSFLKNDYTFKVMVRILRTSLDNYFFGTKGGFCNRNVSIIMILEVKRSNLRLQENPSLWTPTHDDNFLPPQRNENISPYINLPNADTTDMYNR